MGTKNKIVHATPGKCGGHATFKGHRIEVSNLVNYLRYQTPESWIKLFHAQDWITSKEVMEVLRYCRDKICLKEKITCCHCSLNPQTEDESFKGWAVAGEILRRLREKSS